MFASFKYYFVVGSVIIGSVVRGSVVGEFMKQMSLYPTGDFVDGPDALEGACELRVSRFESERRERRERVAQRNRNFKVRV